MHKYAGVGARKTPLNVQFIMTKTATFLENNNYKLLSGGAAGADQAFERGAKFLRESFYAKDATKAAMDIAKKYHPAWDRMGKYAQQLHGRNAFQVLGRDLIHPVDFVICWTPDGCETHTDRTRATGGTGTAISIADAAGIRVYNMFNESSLEELRELFRTIKGRK